MKATVTIDEVGRLILPDAIRQAIGITGPAQVDIEVAGNCARIARSEQPAFHSLRKGARLIYRGPLPEDWHSGEAVLRMREQERAK